MPLDPDKPSPYAVPPIYVVTVLVLHKPLGTTRAKRTWGWHPTHDLAEDALLVNDGDVWENDYTHAVIEEFEPGSPARCTQRWWYVSKRDAAGEFLGGLGIDEPNPLHGVVNFGMG